MWSFLVWFLTRDQIGHLAWSFLVSSLNFLNFGHLSLEKIMVTNFFGRLVTYLSFCTNVCDRSHWIIFHLFSLHVCFINPTNG